METVVWSKEEIDVVSIKLRETDVVHLIELSFPPIK